MSQPPRPLEQLWDALNQSAKSLEPDKLVLLQEALTHTSSGLNPHHEQLEFLGDAVLRLTASEFIAAAYPALTVGERSNLRAQLVSDRWLAELGREIAINQWWHIGAKADGDAAAQDTIRAELSEALIGAVYRINGLTAVHQWLTPYWQRSAEAVLSDPHRANCKSALQEWSQGRGLGLPRYSSEEMSQGHGDPRRFRCFVTLPPVIRAEGWGRSRRDAEQLAAKAALDQLADIAEETPSSAPH